MDERRKGSDGGEREREMRWQLKGNDVRRRNEAAD